jgi:hypothetical protein
LLLSAYYLRKLRPKQGFAELDVFTDEPEKYSDVECRRMLAPWSNWLRIRRCRPTPDPTDDGALTQLEVQRGDIAIAIAAIRPCRNLGRRHARKLASIVSCLNIRRRECSITTLSGKYHISISSLVTRTNSMARQLATPQIACVSLAARIARTFTPFGHKDNVLMYAHQHTPERPMLSTESRLHLKHVECNTPDWLACILEKR